MKTLPATLEASQNKLVWLPIRDGDPRARALYRRHYSWHEYKDNRQHDRFVGPGERLVLITLTCDALFIWRKFRPLDGQQGVNCSVFRNESNITSSQLILSAEELAWKRWPGERLYTYVNPKKIRSANPGYCFLCAGWQHCGHTKSGLVILEKLPT